MAAKRRNNQSTSKGGETDQKLPSGVKLLRAFDAQQGVADCVAFDPHGRLLATGGSDKTVKLWDPGSGKLLRTLQGHEGRVYSLGFDPQGELLGDANCCGPP